MSPTQEYFPVRIQMSGLVEHSVSKPPGDLTNEIEWRGYKDHFEVIKLRVVDTLSQLIADIEQAIKYTLRGASHNKMDQLYADKGFDYTVREVWLRGGVAAGTGLGGGAAKLGGLGGLMDLSLNEGNVKAVLELVRLGAGRDILLLNMQR